MNLGTVDRAFTSCLTKELNCTRKFVSDNSRPEQVVRSLDIFQEMIACKPSDKAFESSNIAGISLPMFCGLKVGLYRCRECAREHRRIATFLNHVIHLPANMIQDDVNEFLSDQMSLPSGADMAPSSCNNCDSPFKHVFRKGDIVYPNYLVMSVELNRNWNLPQEVTLDSREMKYRGDAQHDVMIAKIVQKHGGRHCTYFRSGTSVYEYSEDLHKGFAQMQLMEGLTSDDPNTTAVFYAERSLLKDLYLGELRARYVP